MAACLSARLPPVHGIEQREQCDLTQELKLLLPAPLATNAAVVLTMSEMMKMLSAGRANAHGIAARWPKPGCAQVSPPCLPPHRQFLCRELPMPKQQHSVAQAVTCASTPKMNKFSLPVSSAISMLAPSMVPMMRHPFIWNFMLEVPEASVPAVEMCWDSSAPGMMYSASDTL